MFYVHDLDSGRVSGGFWRKADLRWIEQHMFASRSGPRPSLERMLDDGIEVQNATTKQCVVGQQRFQGLGEEAIGGSGSDPKKVRQLYSFRGSADLASSTRVPHFDAQSRPRIKRRMSFISAMIKP
jgi:hypothetical protein